jgi:diaminopimelate epimerase
MIWSRWSGAGNSFYIADAWTQKWTSKKNERSRQAAEICKIFLHAETDGLLYLEPKKGFDFSWDFYNSDGSSAEMCGNAARCVSQYFQEKIRKQQKLIFSTLAGEVEATVLDNQRVRVVMPRLPKDFQKMEGHLHVNTGVPHFILEQEPSESVALSLRPIPKNSGSNVTFVSQVSGSGCRAVTFERGVERFTEACGTGAVAAGALLTERFGKGRYAIEMPGGTILVADTAPGERPILEGVATKNYDLEYLASWEK